MILVSTNIDSEELQYFNENVHLLYPKLRVTHTDNPKVKFKVVSLEEFPEITNSQVPVITPLVLHQMREKNIDSKTFRFPDHGFVNLHLYMKRVCFSGYGSSKQTLKDKVVRMGGICKKHMDNSTNFLIAKNYKTDHSQFALKKGIPIYQCQYLDDLFQSSEYFPGEKYSLQLFSGLVFTTSCLNSDEKEDVERYILENGGTFTNNLTSNTSYVITQSPCSSCKVKYAINLKQTIISDSFKDRFLTPENLTDDFMPPFINSHLFNKSRFFVVQSLKDDHEIYHEIMMIIKANDGVIIDNKDSASYIIAMDSKLNDLRVRTPIWVERCTQENIILQPSAFKLYTPTNTPRRTGSFNVSLSGFSGQQYMDIIVSLKWLKINFSANLTKKMTHLISKENHVSPKCEAARKWGISIVGIDWIFSIANGILTDEPLSSLWTYENEQTMNYKNNNSNQKSPIPSTEMLNQILRSLPKSPQTPPKNQQTPTNSLKSPKKSLQQSGKMLQSPQKPQSSILKSPLKNNQSQSSQRAPPSPKKLQFSPSKSQQPKRNISFLDDDDIDFEIEEPTVQQNQELKSVVVGSSGNQSPHRTQPQISPKRASLFDKPILQPIEQIQFKSNTNANNNLNTNANVLQKTQTFLSSSSSEDEDILLSITERLEENIRNSLSAASSQRNTRQSSNSRNPNNISSEIPLPTIESPLSANSQRNNQFNNHPIVSSNTNIQNIPDATANNNYANDDNNTSHNNNNNHTNNINNSNRNIAESSTDDEVEVIQFTPRNTNQAPQHVVTPPSELSNTNTKVEIRNTPHLNSTNANLPASTLHNSNLASDRNPNGNTGNGMTKYNQENHQVQQRVSIPIDQINHGKPQLLNSFLDDEEDDDIYDAAADRIIVEYEMSQKKIHDATLAIIHSHKSKRKRKKETKPKSDLALEALDSFTQRFVESDEEDIKTVSYGENEGIKATSVDGDDPFLSML